MIKNHAIKYCTTVYERNGKKIFWSIKNSGEILNTLKSRGFLASSLSTYDFSTLYTTLPQNLIKEKLTELIEQTFNREGSLCLACNDKNAFFTSSDTEAPFLDLNLSITNGIVSSKIYDKQDDFNFEIVNFQFLDGDVPHSSFYGVYISQLIRFARVCSNVNDFNNINSFLTDKLLKQSYRYHKFYQTLRVNCYIQHWVKNSSATRHTRTYILW